MRSGTNYVGTDFYTNQSQTFYFTASRVSGTRDVKIDWWMTTDCNDSAASPTYYLCYKQQRLVVNGSEVINWVGTTYADYPTYNDGGSLVWRGFTDTGSWLDKNYNKSKFWDINGDYSGIQRWVGVLGTKWTTGSFRKTADNNGNISFTVAGYFGWYGKTGLNFSKTFTVTGLVPVNAFTISFTDNAGSFVKGNVVRGLPSAQTKEYDKTIKLSSTVPVTTDGNYVFYRWSTSVSDSFSYGSNYRAWYPGENFSDNASYTLKAVWKKAQRTISFNLDGGEPETSNVSFDPISAYYSDRIVLPSFGVSKYGYKLSGWKNMITGNNYALGANYTVTKNATLVAQYEGETYTITLLRKDGSVLRTLTQKFGEPVSGDFSYSELGYDCAGWSITHFNEESYMDTELPPIAPNNPAELANKIYMGCGDYTNTPFMIDDSTKRVHVIGYNVVLFPVLRYVTSFYIYDDGWKLAIPYVYDDGWKQSIGSVYDIGWNRTPESFRIDYLKH